MEDERHGMHIDPHVHCRDWAQSYKATIKSVTEIARSQGVVAIFDMPNTEPSITTQELVEKRLKTAEKEGCIDGYYLYIGLVNDAKQITKATEIVNSNPKVVGMKMYAGKSTGDLTISDETGQRNVYKELADCGYEGVLAVHCEKDSLAKMDLWDPKNPSSWNLARPPEMEIESLRDQINFAIEYNFKGNLNICHASTPESVMMVDKARKQLKISCGVTPHHLTYSTSEMKGEEGTIYKVNPPIRDKERVAKMNEYLRQGKIDWIETDHAPHTIEEKQSKSAIPPSGIQSLATYASFLGRLTSEGFTQKQIDDLTYWNIKKVFKKVVE